MYSIDDDNRIVLKPLPNNQTFYHDFINAGYIDVSDLSRFPVDLATSSYE